MTSSEATAWFQGHDSIWLRPEATNPYPDSSPSLLAAWHDGRCAGAAKHREGMCANDAGVQEPRDD